MHVRSLHGNREISRLASERSTGGPHREGEEPKPMMHGREKSDSPIVAEKSANNPERRPGAESVEPRGGAKGNAEQSRTCRTQGRESVFQRLDRVRQAARQRKKEKFTALMHLVDVELFSSRTSGSTERSGRGGRRHVATVRRGSRRTARATARAHPSQRLPGDTVSAPVHPQSRPRLARACATGLGIRRPGAG